jgi:MoxR-like ATPase
MPEFIQFADATKTVPLAPRADGSACCHEWDQAMKGAVNAAIAANRPLLVRGEPGLGKTQLAEAAAQELERAFITCVVDSRTEHRDLLWRFDAVKRLAFAQIAPHHPQFRENTTLFESALSESNFVTPGPFWWALNWEDARTVSSVSSDLFAGSKPLPVNTAENPLSLDRNDEFKTNGWVLLVDEIDKAEIDVPNGLLESLGSHRFTPYGRSKPVTLKGIPPLVIITTNEERSLPAAFLRRCIVLQLTLPTDRDGLVSMLVRRGRSHFGDRTNDTVLQEAAKLVWDQRELAKQTRLKPLPGQAEFLDLMRVVIGQYPKKMRDQKSMLASVSDFILKKHPLV